MHLAEALAVCGADQQGMATADQLGACGIRSPRLTVDVQRGMVTRLRRRVYAPAPLPLIPRFVVTDRGVAPEYVAHVRSALLSLGPTATAAGRTAAALRGWPMLVEPSRTVHVAVPHGRATASTRGVHARQRRDLARERVRVLQGTREMWVTNAVQTVLDCALELPLLQGVVVCDSALRSGRVTQDELLVAGASLRGVADAAKARRVFELADARSGSVLESVLRVQLVLAGVTGFTMQRSLTRPDGSPLLRVDFCFDDARLVIEVDGQKWHQDVSRDRRLDNALVSLGWRVLRYGWADVVHASADVVDEIQLALDRPGLRVQSGVADGRAAA